MGSASYIKKEKISWECRDSRKMWGSTTTTGLSTFSQKQSTPIVPKARLVQDEFFSSPSKKKSSMWQSVYKKWGHWCGFLSDEHISKNSESCITFSFIQNLTIHFLVHEINLNTFRTKLNCTHFCDVFLHNYLSQVKSVWSHFVDVALVILLVLTP